MMDSTARFLAPASFGDAMLIESAVTRVGRSSIGGGHRMLRDGVLCVEATEVRVWAAARDGQPGIRSIPIPEDLARRLRGE